MDIAGTIAFVKWLCAHTETTPATSKKQRKKGASLGSFKSLVEAEVGEEEEVEEEVVVEEAAEAVVVISLPPKKHFMKLYAPPMQTLQFPPPIAVLLRLQIKMKEKELLDSMLLKTMIPPPPRN